ncbi:hypothetical protein ABID29_001020 [Streptococcus rupicaprae]|uniref:LXG domain-containing protein n=1 Tax=Streptococcus rupicaprae TaxID=759619 RepID=A0ABV2FHC6_9STRE
MSDISSSRVSAYHTSLTALAAFSGEGNLKGKAYDSAKQFAGSVLVPLLQGGILLSEEISRATKGLPEEYRSRVSSEDLDSEVLEAQIQSYDASIAQTQSLIRSELSKDSMEDSDLIYLQKLYHRQVQARNKLQEKLDKLLAFDGYSPSLFNSISALEGAVNDGLAVVTGSFSGFSGSFSLPSNMGWAKTIGSQWQVRSEGITQSYQAIVDKVSRGEALTEEDIEAIQRYQELYPGVELEKKVEEAIKVYNIEQNYQLVLAKAQNNQELVTEDIVYIIAYGKIHPNSSHPVELELAVQNYLNKGDIEKNFTIITTTGNEMLGNFLEDSIEGMGRELGKAVSEEIYTNRYSIELTAGVILGKTPGATRAVTETAETMIVSGSKALGKGISFSTGTLIGVGINMLSGDTAEEAWGKELTVGVTTAVVSGGVYLSSVGLTAVGLISAPVTLGIGATIVLGVGVSMINDWAREQWPELKEFEDNVGRAVVDTWNNATEMISNVWDFANPFD